MSLCQATLAGVGAFTAAQVADRLGANLLVGALVGALVAALVAVVLATASVRLRGLGLALMTIAAALVFDNAIFAQVATIRGQSINVTSSSVGFGILNPNGRAFFVLAMVVLSVCVVLVLRVRNGSIGRFLGAMRGSSTAASGIGVNLTWMHVLVFGLSGAVAGLGGTLLAINQQAVNTQTFSWSFSLVFVVVVVTTGVSTPEGAIQAGFSFVVLQQLLTYVPSRLGGNSLLVILFAFGALTYVAHPEGILEFQKRRWTMRFERLLLRQRTSSTDISGPDAGATAGDGQLARVAADSDPALDR